MPVTDPELVFDGDCGICTVSAAWVDRNCPGVTTVSHHARGMTAIDKVTWIDGDDRREGARAVAAVLRRARRRRHRAVGAIIGSAPVRPVAEVIYLIVARNRSRISRLVGAKACGLPVAPVSVSRDSGGASDGVSTGGGGA
jgi:predicted DCC family thiol-disulfide oxidoreductase YuxK